ncbi:MAG: tetratricopeptide repeat protein, partial [Opitutus sp.]
PDWLWGDFATWIFAAPRTFSQLGEANQYAEHALCRMEELARWVGRNFGSSAVRAALDSYLRSFSFLPLAVSNDTLKRHAEVHGRLLTAGVKANAGIVATTGDRVGRALRVAFIGYSPGSIPEFSRLMAPDRFEISLYVLDGADEANGAGDNAVPFAILSLMQAGNRTRQYQGLSSNLTDQLSELQTANLDAVVFCDELAATDGRLHRLAIHRLAPLHVFVNSTVTSGLPPSDLMFVGNNSGPDDSLRKSFTERLSFRPGCGFTFAEIPAFTGDRSEPRVALNLPSGAFLMMTAGRMLEITPELRASWIQILKTNPRVSLGIQLLHTGELIKGDVEAWAAEWDRALVEMGIATDRVLIFGAAPESLVDLQRILAPADLFLDVGAFGESELLNVPLSLSIPIVTTEGVTWRQRRGAGLLLSVGLEDLIARDEPHLREIVQRLASDPKGHDEVVVRIRTKLQRLPLFHDQLAGAENLSSAIEQAYDDLHATELRVFRNGPPLTPALEHLGGIESALREGESALANGEHRNALKHARDVLRVSPSNFEARRIVGVVCLANQEYARAVDYLLAAVQTFDDAGTWYSLAVALYRNGQKGEAVQALETTLRVDATRVDAWALLVELAIEVGADELAREALDAFAQLAPDDARVVTLTQQLRLA